MRNFGGTSVKELISVVERHISEQIKLILSKVTQREEPSSDLLLLIYLSKPK